MMNPERVGDLTDAVSVSTLRDRIRTTLAPVVRGHSECALIGFPDTSNVGDGAIWLGELAWLEQAGIRVAYRCHERSYDPDILRQSCPRGVIFLGGGGNLGDVWPRPQRLRERVIRDFPARPIVQLPQSIHFTDRHAAARARAVFDGHGNFTMFVRDSASLDVARREFRNPALLCPDMAFYLGPLARARDAEVDVLWLRRSDVEAVPYPQAIGTTAVMTDWLHAWPPLVRRIRDTCQPVLHGHARALGVVRRIAERSLDYQARARLRFGCDLLARGRMVVTDRLHGHILCLLLGIPHVVLDNSYGKLRNFHGTWTRSMRAVRWVESPADVPAALEQLRG